MANFKNEAAGPSWIADTQSTVADVARYFKEASYGRADLTVEVRGPTEISSRPSYLGADGNHGYGQMMDDAIVAANQQQSLAAFEVIVTLIDDKPDMGGHFFGKSPGNYFSGSTIRAAAYFSRTAEVSTMAHELIHSETGYPDLYSSWNSPGQFDVMSMNRGQQPTAFTRWKCGWLDEGDAPASPVRTITRVFKFGGETRTALRPLELDPGGGLPSALRVEVDDNETYWIELRRKLGDWDGGKPNLSSGLPSDGDVAVYYVNEELPRAMHLRKLLRAGDSYTSANHGITVTREQDPGDPSASAQVKVNMVGVRQLIGGPLNWAVGAFFAQEATLLAESFHFKDPARNVTSPQQHLQWAVTQSPSSVAQELTDRAMECIHTLAAAPATVDKAADFYAAAAVRIGCLGVNLDDGQPIPWIAAPANSSDYSMHRTFALGELRKAVDRIDLVIEQHFRGMVFHLSEATENFLRALFTSESVGLAYVARSNNGRDHFQESPRNDTSPGSHAAWARSVPVDQVRDDLNAKYAFQLTAQSTHSAVEMANLYTDITIRLNRFGVDFGSDSANSMNRDVHYSWAVATPVDTVRAEMARRVTTLFKKLR